MAPKKPFKPKKHSWIPPKAKLDRMWNEAQVKHVQIEIRKIHPEWGDARVELETLEVLKNAAKIAKDLKKE